MGERSQSEDMSRATLDSAHEPRARGLGVTTFNSFDALRHDVYEDTDQ